MTARRVSPCLVATLALVLPALAVVSSAAAAAGGSCARQVIDDWWDNDRVDERIYPLHCYRDDVEIFARAGAIDA